MKEPSPHVHRPGKAPVPGRTSSFVRSNGWFVDPTPALDEEFARLGCETQLTAVDARAADKIDLLTVIEHELGHIAGFGDLDTSANSLLSGSLKTGVRRVTTANEVDAVFAAQGMRLQGV